MDKIYYYLIIIHKLFNNNINNNEVEQGGKRHTYIEAGILKETTLRTKNKEMAGGRGLQND